MLNKDSITNKIASIELIISISIKVFDIFVFDLGNTFDKSRAYTKRYNTPNKNET